jgi:general nucleoside transport system permease protein
VSGAEAIVVSVAAAAVFYGTPLVYSALGELLAERSGVVNLGIEGMMLVGAVAGFWTVTRIQQSDASVLPLAIAVAAFAGGAVALIHAVLVVSLRGNQIVSGLALTIFGGAGGLSSYIGSENHLGGVLARHRFQGVAVPVLRDLPILGDVLFRQNVLVYCSWALVLVVAFYLWRTRPGLHLRAVGEAPAAADSLGVSVTAYRYAHTVAGGCLAGVGGACFSLAITPDWSNGLTAGAGWIALALVIFSFWRPQYVLLGAYAFGGFASLGFVMQAHGVHWPPELLSALPYLMTIVVLVIVSAGRSKRRGGAPAALGVAYVREAR